MKKLFTFCLSMLFIGTAYAQIVTDEELDESFVFTDFDGNVIANGTTIVVNELNEEGQMVVPLKAKNVSGEKVAVSMYEELGKKPNGEWQTCAFGNCMTLAASGYSPKNIMAADYNADIQTEWMPVSGGYATWEAKLQIHVFNITKKTQFGQTIETAGNEVIGYGPVVTVRFEYKAPSQQAETTKAWWGYVGADENLSGVGVRNAETYDCAAFFPGDHPVAAGKTIHSIRFALFSTNVKDVKVWIAESLPRNVNSNTVQVVSVSDLKQGINDVALNTPYTIGEKGVYVGYSFTITKVEYTNDAYPVCFAGNAMKDALYLRTSASVTEWSDVYDQGFGRLYLQMELEGDFPYKNAATFSYNDLGEYVAPIGGAATAYMFVTNMGTEDITSIDYTITSDGVTSSEHNVTFGTPIGYGSSQVIPFEVRGDDVAGNKVKTVTITKVNGIENEYEDKVAQFTMATISKLVERGVAVEEFTGTQCGWCPRGIAGMEKLRRTFGDKFVGAAVHGYANGTSDDAMYIAGWGGSSYARIFSGSAPSCQLNRAYGEIDPYYGTGNDICDDFRNELSVPAKVGITLKGEWNADSTKVVATATLEAVADNQNFTIEYALIADSLTGTASSWNQENYYASSTSSDPDLAPFCRGGKYGQATLKSWVFYDAVIATCYKSGKNQTTAPGSLSIGETVTNTFTLDMPTNATLLKAITKERVAVIALVINSDGTVANAAKFYMPGYNALNGITTTELTTNSAVQSRYSLDGRQLPAAQKGLNIVRMGDGSVRKVVIK